MAQIDFQAFMRRSNPAAENSSGNNSNKVSYFSLKNDKDEAIVRFMIDGPDDFDIIVAHQVKINGYNRSVNCIRSAYDPVDNCPLCAAGLNVRYKFYIKLVEYVKGEDGKIQAMPRIWERSSPYITTFNDLLNEYGPLSDQVFKIKRNGAPGSRDTTYSILYANQSAYNTLAFAKLPDAFKDYKVLGHAVIDKDYQGLQELLNSLGDNIEEGTQENSQTQVMPRTVAYTVPTENSVLTTQGSENVVTSGFAQTTEAPAQPESAQRPAPTQTQMSNNNGFGRPRRFY